MAEALAERPATAKFYGLQQQAEREDDGAGEPHLCLSDYVAPRDGGPRDWIGMFACTAGHGLEEVVAEAKANNDDHSSYIIWPRRSPTASPRPWPSACTSSCAARSGATRRARR